MKWTADGAYVMDAADTICVISGRTFKKVNPGISLAAYYYTGGYTGPLLVSTDPDAVTFNAGPSFTYNATIEYLDMTWYISPPDYFMGGNATSSSGPALKLEGTYGTNVAAALALLETANVRLREKAKYLVQIDGVYYDNELNVIEAEEITDAVMLEYGSNELTLDLTGYSKVEILKYDTSESRELLKVKTTAVPVLQAVVTNEIDLSNPTITGIESVTVESEGSPAFAISFDSGGTWNMHNGTAWVVLSEDSTGMQAETLEAITTEQWQEQITGVNSILLRFTLAEPIDAVARVLIDFTN